MVGTGNHVNDRFGRHAGFVILDATLGFDGQVRDDVCPGQLEEHFLKQVLLP
jgi:hypothetical protein